MDSVSDRETDNIRTDKIVDIPLVSADVSEEEGELLFIADTIVETFLEDDAQYLNAALNIRRQTFILGSATLEEDRVLHYLREQESTGLSLANFLRWKLNEFRNDDASVPNNLQPFCLQWTGSFNLQRPPLSGVQKNQKVNLLQFLSSLLPASVAQASMSPWFPNVSLWRISCVQSFSNTRNVTSL